MSLMSLPNELLIHIAKESACMLTTSGLLQCNSHLRNLLISEFFQHIQDFHTGFYARARNAGHGGKFGPVRDRALYLLQDLASKTWMVDDFPRNFGWWCTDTLAVRALLGFKTLLNPKSCMSLIDVTATNNPLRAALVRHDLRCAGTILNWWIHPTCLSTVPVDCVRLNSSSYDFPSTLKFLTKYGVKVDFRADDLRKAICDQDESMVEYLLQKGVGRTFPDQGTFFEQAIPTGNAKIVELLFNFGVNPSQKDNALEKAIATGNTHVVRLLLKNTKPPPRSQALIETVRAGNTELLELLLKNNVRPSHREEALREAIRTGDVKLVELLFQYDVTLPCGNGEFAEAIEAGNINILELLFEKGRKPNSGGLAIQKAISTGNEKILALLLKNEIKPDWNQGMCANAISTGNIKLVEMLYRHCLKPFSNEKSGVFTHAISTGNERQLRPLLENNIKPSVTDFSTVFAACAGKNKMLEILLENDIKPSTRHNKVFMSAIRPGNTEVVKLLFKYGVEASPREKEVVENYKTVRPGIYKLFQKQNKKQKRSKKTEENRRELNKIPRGLNWIF